jgi:hypothetical protein
MVIVHMCILALYVNLDLPLFRSIFLFIVPLHFRSFFLAQFLLQLSDLITFGSAQHFFLSECFILSSPVSEPFAPVSSLTLLRLPAELLLRHRFLELSSQAQAHHQELHCVHDRLCRWTALT